MATGSKEDMKRLAEMYADRLTRNARYGVEAMTELTGSGRWRGGSGAPQRGPYKPPQGKAVHALG